MIPKKIHYCWFGGSPLPQLAKKCIKSWKKYFPDYEIIEWNESNFNIDACLYTQEAYKAKKYAFVSDYARFWILYNYGGIYFDTDVEVIKPMENIINQGPFMGCEIKGADERWPRVACGLGIAVYSHHPIYKEILDHYEQSKFILDNGELNYLTVVSRVTEVLKRHKLQPTDKLQVCDDITIYPPDFFCPKSFETREINITKNTVAIHHFDASWMSGSFLFNLMRKLIGTEYTFKLKSLWKR